MVMKESDNQLQFHPPGGITTDEAIQHMKQAIAEGKHWYIALLEAIGLWSKAEETHNGRHYRYLVGGEAFDWLLLAERLCLEIDGLFPEKERDDLLFRSKPPCELSKEEFAGFIGYPKYRAYLNYYYGIVVEETLLLAVEEEVRKERQALFCCSDDLLQEEVYRRIYGADTTTLWQWFREEKGYPRRKSITLTERKEFVYWLFKLRLKHCEKTKSASDTKKALRYLQRQKATSNPADQTPAEEPCNMIDLFPEACF